MGFAMKIFVFSVLGYMLISSHGVCGIQDCRAHLDMVIIVDCSLSVGKENFDKIKTFLKHLIEQLPVQLDGIRVGVVRYGSKVDVISNLDDHMNKTQKIAAIDGMRFRGGSTFTHLALRKTRTDVLSASRGDRPDVPDLVILTTDGKSVNETWTATEAMALKAKDDLKIFVIGIGTEVDDTELAAVASRLEMVYKLTEFTQLPEILGNLARFSCSDMKEDSITALTAWPNSGLSFVLPTTQVSLISTTTTPPQYPPTSLSSAPSTIATTALTSTSSSTTSTVLPLTSRSTTNFISNIPSTTLNLLTNETTLPSTELLDTSEVNAFLLTRVMNEDLYNSRLTTQTLTEFLDSSLTTKMENNSESTSNQETITDGAIFLYDTVKYETETPSSTQNVTNYESHTSSTDETTNSTSQTTQHPATLLMSPHKDFDDQRDIQDSTKELHTIITSTSTKQLHTSITSTSTKQLHTRITSTSTKQLHTRITSTSDTTTAESSLASTDVTQSDKIRINNFTTPHSATNSTVGSLLSSSNNTITPSITSGTISPVIPTQASTMNNSTLSLSTFPHLTTINKINNPTSTASTAAVSEISQAALSQTSSSQITTTIRQRRRKLISRTSTASTQSSVGKSQTQETRDFTSKESGLKHDRTSLDSRVLIDTTKDYQFSRSSTQESTSIVEYETFADSGNISSINNTTTNYIHNQTGGDISSRDVYIFIAGGSATAIILLATGTFLSVICRRRNRNRNLERAVTAP